MKAAGLIPWGFVAAHTFPVACVQVNPFSVALTICIRVHLKRLFQPAPLSLALNVGRRYSSRGPELIKTYGFKTWHTESIWISAWEAI